MFNEEIEQKLSSTNENECWTIGRKPHKNGYIYWKNKRLHRLVWEMHNAEPIPDGMVIRHKCDNRECCNPFHLELGTQAQNIQDMIERGRSRWSGYVKPPKVPKELKINSQVIDKVKQLLSQGLTLREVAKELNISCTSVHRISKAA